MSWSVKFIGTAENVSKALTAQSEKFQNQAKVEYDAAYPHIVALVNENFGTNIPLIKLAASGCGYSVDGEHKERELIVSIERIYGELV